MRILAIDDEKLALFDLKNAILAVQPDADLYTFNKPSQLLEFIHAEPPRIDIAFLDIQMQGVTGLELAEKLRALWPKLNVIFVTGYSEYASKAFDLRASGYLLKPVTAEAVAAELRNLRFPDIKARRVRIQTFGQFAVFVDGEPLIFSRARAEELLAYLVDRRGAPSSTAELAALLWDDRPYGRSVKNQVQNVLRQLMDTLDSKGVSDIIIKGWNSLAVDTAKIDCDYYGFLEGDPACINSFTGEYMARYSCAEFTTATLQQRFDKELAEK